MEQKSVLFTLEEVENILHSRERWFMEHNSFSRKGEIFIGTKEWLSSNLPETKQFEEHIEEAFNSGRGGLNKYENWFEDKYGYEPKIQ